MLDYETADSDIHVERLGDLITITVPKEGFVRTASREFRRPGMWIILTLLLVAGGWNTGRRFWQGRPGAVTPSLVADALLPLLLVVGYVALLSQSGVTIRLYRESIVWNNHGLFGLGDDRRLERREVTNIAVDWINVSLVLDEPARHHSVLISGRSSEVRERLARMLREWLAGRLPGVPA